MNKSMLYLIVEAVKFNGLSKQTYFYWENIPSV